jgi:glycerol-3-phosphate dehydrogenase (NAD(P)+)
MNPAKLTVLGAGAWGTAVADHLSRCGHEVVLWAFEEEVSQFISRHHENQLFLPGIMLSESLRVTSDLSAAILPSQYIFLAVPSKHVRGIIDRCRQELADKPLVNLSKGFESQTRLTISQVAVDLLGPDCLKRWVTLSGPSFARELAKGHPTAIVAASENDALSSEIQQRFSSDSLRLYRSKDLRGIEVGGSLKNIMAIASGIVHGCGYGTNTTATLVTRASVEISRFGLQMGASIETFWGLAGIGDLMLTCFGPLSRNFQLGEQIAKGVTLEEVLSRSRTIVEGVETTRAVWDLSRQHKIDMPITEQVHGILFEGRSPQEALKNLMKRSLKTEWVSR